MTTRRHSDQKQFDNFAKDYDTRFIKSYLPVYELFCDRLSDTLKIINQSLRVLDVGCGNGWIAEQISQKSFGVYIGVDPSEASLEILKERLSSQKKLKVFTFCQSAEWICHENAASVLYEKLGGNPQLVICNAAFHQIRKTFPDVKSLIMSLYNLQVSDGVALFGDYHYPKNLSKAKIQKALNWIKKETGQNPTPPAG